MTWPGKEVSRSPWRKIWSWDKRMVYVRPMGALQGPEGCACGLGRMGCVTGGVWGGVCVCAGD